MIHVYQIPQNGLDYRKPDYGRGDKYSEGSSNVSITNLLKKPNVDLYIVNYAENTIIRCVNNETVNLSGKMVRSHPLDWTVELVKGELADGLGKVKPRACDIIAVENTSETTTNIYKLTNDGVLFDVFTNANGWQDINLYIKTEKGFSLYTNITANDLKCNPVYAVLDFHGVTKYIVKDVIGSTNSGKEYTSSDNSKVLPVILWPKIGKDKLNITAYNGSVELSDIKYSKLSLNESSQTLVNKNGVLLVNRSQGIGELDVRNLFKNTNIDSSEEREGQIYKPTHIVRICSESGYSEWNKKDNKYGANLSTDEFTRVVNYMDSLLGYEPNESYVRYPVSSSLFNYSKIYGVNMYKGRDLTHINVIKSPETFDPDHTYQKLHAGYIYARTQYDNFIKISESGADSSPILACILYDQPNPELNDYTQFNSKYAISCGDFGSDLSAFDSFTGDPLDEKNIGKFIYGEITRDDVIDIRFDKHPGIEGNIRPIQCADIYVGKYIKINVQGNLKGDNKIKVRSELKTIDDPDEPKRFRVTSDALPGKDGSYYIRASYLNNELVVGGDHSYTLQSGDIVLTRNGNSWIIPQDAIELTLITETEQERTFKVEITHLGELANPIKCKITPTGIPTISIDTKSSSGPVEFKKVTGTDIIGVNVEFDFNGNGKVIALIGNKEFDPGSNSGIANIKAGNDPNIITFKRKGTKPVTIFFALYDTDLKDIANPDNVNENWKKISVNLATEVGSRKYTYTSSKSNDALKLPATLTMERNVFKDVIITRQFDVTDTSDDIAQPISKIVVGNIGKNDNKYATYNQSNLKYYEVTSAENIGILTGKSFSQFNEIKNDTVFKSGKTYVILIGVGRGNPISDASVVETDWDNKVYTGPLVGYIPDLNNQKEFNCPKFDLNAIDWDSLLGVYQNRNITEARNITRSTDIIESCGTAHAAYQSGNQFIYFRRSNPYNNAPLGQTVLGHNTQKETRFEINMFEQNAIFNTLSNSKYTLKNRHDKIDKEAKERDNIDDIMNDINTSGVLFVGPYLSGVNKMCINSDNTNSYLTLGPGESVEVPVVIIYRASSDVPELSFNMGFDIRNSLYNDPLYFQMTFNARYEQTASDMIGGDNGGPKYNITNV